MEARDALDVGVAELDRAVEGRLRAASVRELHREEAGQRVVERLAGSLRARFEHVLAGRARIALVEVGDVRAAEALEGRRGFRVGAHVERAALGRVPHRVEREGDEASVARRRLAGPDPDGAVLRPKDDRADRHHHRDRIAYAAARISRVAEHLRPRLRIERASLLLDQLVDPAVPPEVVTPVGAVEVDLALPELLVEIDVRVAEGALVPNALGDVALRALLEAEHLARVAV